jgi:GAF domain-containing protein
VGIGLVAEGTPPGTDIIATLEAERAHGASLDELLEAAVRSIEAADPRYDWVGIYLLEEDLLSLHSYIGRPTEHTSIPVGVGVCGAAIAERRDINVPDVRAVENYLACSAETRSELVVLIRDGQASRIYGQIDLDSDQAGAFTEADVRALRPVADWLADLFAKAEKQRTAGRAPGDD